MSFGVHLNRIFDRRPWGVSTLALIGLVACGPGPADLAITDVTVIDPASGNVLQDQTVVVADGVIRSVFPSPSGKVPEASTVVDGTGRYLIPGLWDMHTHVDGHRDTDLAMLVVHGVLNVRDMGGDPFVLADLKVRIADGDLLGPTVRGAGAIVEDRAWLTRARSIFEGLEHRVPVDNPEEARASVALLESWGVDLIKTRNVTDRATLAAILNAAKEHGLTVAGHEPMIVDIDEAAELGMTTFEHFPFITLTMPGRVADEARIALAVETLAASGAYVNPTLIATRGMGKTREERAAAIEVPDERYRYLPASVKEGWVSSLDGDAGPLPWQDMIERSLVITRQMLEAGVPLLAGTDMGVPLTFPGSSLHEELGLMVERIGVTPMEALQAATTAPAALFGLSEGSVAEGVTANLVLLDADPLEDISNTRSVAGVVLRGDWLGRARLDEILDWVRETKDVEPGPTLYEALEASCRTEETPECLERLAGYQFSRMLYTDARGTYREALDAGAGSAALEGWFAATVNARHDGQLGCAEAREPTDQLLAAHPGDLRKRVGVLDRVLPALGGECPEEAARYLNMLAGIDESGLDDEMRPIYREHYAAFLFRVKGDGEAAYAYRVANMPEGWRQNHIQLREVASWCLELGIGLGSARELAQRAAQVTEIPMIRLQSMLLEARIASAAGDHRDAVALMETIDAAVPNNTTVTSLLEKFRQLAAQEG